MASIVPDDGDLDRTSAIAWGYICPPSFYKEAVVQWRAQLDNLAAREGFIIERWFFDGPGRTAGLEIMWSMLPRSGVQALFVAHPAQLYGLRIFKDASLIEIRDELPLQLFVLDETFAPIQRMPRQEPPHHRRRRWLHFLQT